MISYKISLAAQSDVMDLFELANDQEVRNNSFNQGNITIEEHKKWFEEKLKNKNCYFYIIRQNHDFIGSVRFDSDEENQFTISIQIAKKYRGKGLSGKIISDATGKFLSVKSDAKIIAKIKCSNLASIKAFTKSGYEIITTESACDDYQFHVLEYKNTNENFYR